MQTPSPSTRAPRPGVVIGLARLLALVLAVGAPPSQAFGQTLVVSQLYGAGGNASATFQNDYVEIHNVGSETVAVDGLSVQYASATGTGNFGSNPVASLTGSIPAGGFYLVRLAGGATGAPVPAPDALGTANMAAASGKVALVRGTAGLACNGGSTLCDADSLARIIDLVGYGAANFFEGAGPAPGASATTAVLRNGNGCTDTNQNGSDLTAGAPEPRNSASPVVICGAPPPPPPPPTCTPTHTIAAIQGAGSASPLAGTTVGTTGIVTARWTIGSARGFFMQMAEGDGDPATSDGIFVFTGSTDPPAVAAVGNEVCVSGPVAEFVPSSDPGSRPVTEINRPTLVQLIADARPVPDPVTLQASDVAPGGGLEALERFEGMRVRAAALSVVGPTGGSLVERDATAASNGQFFGVLAGVARPFREPGVDVHDVLPPGAPAGVVRFDSNPERLRVDSDALGAPALDVSAGQTVANLTGPLHYGFRTYTILPEPGSVPEVSGVAAAQAVPAPAPGELTVASFNLQRLFDTFDEPGRSDVVMSPEGLERRLAKLSLSIRTVLKLPDILGVEEAENLGVLQLLAARVNADEVASGAPDPGYRAELVEGNDPGGIDVGVLIKTARVELVDVTQEGRDATYVNPLDGQPALLNDRPPLVVRTIVQLPKGRLPLTVIVNHLRSLTGVDDAADGPRVRAKRRAQAEFLAALVHARQSADPGERLVLVGDFNAFEFSDGYVDVVGTAKGTPAPPSEVVLPSDDLLDPDLANALDAADPALRYTYSFDGNAQSLDHILVNGVAALHATRVAIAHANADFAETLRNDSTRPERASDHDVPVVYLEWVPEEVTRFVEIRRHPIRAIPGLGVALGVIQARNVSEASLQGPFHLVFEGLPDGVRVVGAHGEIGGAPVLTLPLPRTLRPGQTAPAIVLFLVPPAVVVNFVLRVFAGVL